MNKDIKLPLRKEIELIKKLRPGFNDVILIDDLRIYETGPYKSGNMPDNILAPSVRNVDFVTEAFAKSHNIQRSFLEEGYLLVLPKK